MNAMYWACTIVGIAAIVIGSLGLFIFACAFASVGVFIEESARK